MNVGVTMAGRMLAHAAIQSKTGVLVFYSGTQPATPETPLSGNTELVRWQIAGPAFGSVSGSDVLAQIVFVNNVATITNSGTVTFARMYPPNWQQNTQYINNQAIITSDGYIAFAVPNGPNNSAGVSSNAGSGPLGATLTVSSSVPDGTVWWSGYGVAGTGLADFTVGTSATDIIVASTTLTATNFESIALNLEVPFV